MNGHLHFDRRTIPKLLGILVPGSIRRFCSANLRMKKASVFTLAIVFSVVLVAPLSPAAMAPTSRELHAEHSWVKEHLLECKFRRAATGTSATAPQAPWVGLVVLANNDAVTRNGRGNARLKIGDKEYTRGLYCHAVSRVDPNSYLPEMTSLELPDVRERLPGRPRDAYVRDHHRPGAQEGAEPDRQTCRFTRPYAPNDAQHESGKAW